MINLSRISILVLWAGTFWGCKNASLTDRQITDGKEVVLALKPGPDNPRNSEGDFIELKDGRLLFIYSRYTGVRGEDDSPAHLAGRYSSDEGKTWTTKDEVILEREGQLNSMSVSLLRLKDSSIALFYLRKNSLADCMPLMRISTDEAATWSAPISCIPDKKGYFVLNNNRVIQLNNGRLLLSVSLHRLAGSGWNDTGRLLTYYSDDNGRKWKFGGEVPNPDKVLVQEPGMVELKNGNIMMFARTNTGVQYESYSNDNGISWSPASPSNIKSPTSPASIARIPDTGDLLLLWNNNDGSIPNNKEKRSPYNVAVSKDEGKTWQHVKVIENHPDGWYCYTAIHFSGKHVLLGHCAGMRSQNGLAVTHITRLSLDWIYQ
jgi:sialidase-1